MIGIAIGIAIGIDREGKAYPPPPDALKCVRHHLSPFTFYLTPCAARLGGPALPVVTRFWYDKMAKL